MSKLFNLAKMTTATTGTGTITLGSAVSGFLSFAAAGVANADVVSYGISDGANSEVGYGTYTSAGTTLARTTILASTNSGSAINLSGTATVFITALKEDVIKDGWQDIHGTFTYASATTINVSAGAASIYNVGDKIRYQNNDSGTYLYDYVVVIADTLLTVAGDAVPNATLTDKNFSKECTPIGFPNWFALGTPTWTTSGTAFTNQPTGNSFRFSMIGKNVYIAGGATCHATSGGTGTFTITFPAGSLPTSWGVATTGTAINASTSIFGLSFISASSSAIIIAKYDGTTLATNSQIMVLTIIYLAA